MTAPVLDVAPSLDLGIITGITQPLNLKDLFTDVDFTSDLAFYGLAGTALLTFQGSLDHDNRSNKERRALSIETVVNLIAAVVYMELRPALKSNSLARASDLRYTDWLLTTPLLLVSLTLFLQESPAAGAPNGILGGASINGMWLLILLLANTVMLLCGRQARGDPGSQAVISKPFIGAWLCFLLIAVVYLTMYYWVWVVYVFVAVWALYGVAFLAPVAMRESAYNLLDLVSKVGFGMFLYFGWN